MEFQIGKILNTAEGDRAVTDICRRQSSPLVGRGYLLSSGYPNTANPETLLLTGHRKGDFQKQCEGVQ